MEDINDPFKWVSKERLEFLADGIFAIVITLLVLELKVPASEAIASTVDLCHLLKAMLPTFASYIMSFVVLMGWWSTYTTQFKYIERCDRILFFINVYFLLAISLIPFSTAFLSEHIHFRLSIAIYWFNLLLIGSGLGMNWAYANKHELLKKPSAELRGLTRIFFLRATTAMPVYTIGALLCLVSNYLSIGVILLMQIFFQFGFDQKIRMRIEQNSL